MSVPLSPSVNNAQQLKSSATDEAHLNKPNMQSPVKEKKVVEQTSDPKINKDYYAKRKLFALNAILSTVMCGALALNAKDDQGNVDVVGQRFGLQDAVTNSSIAYETMMDPNATKQHLMETMKETTAFLAPTALFSSNIAQKGKSDFSPYTIAGAMTPVVVSEGIGRIFDKKVKLSEAELKEQRKDITKTHTAVALAALGKLALLGYHINRPVEAGKDKKTIYVMMMGTILNTLKTSLTTEEAHRRGFKVRSSKNAAPVVFDGVVSGTMVPIAETIFKYLGAPIKAATGMEYDALPNIVAQSLLSGYASFKGIQVVRNNVDRYLDKILGRDANEQLSTQENAQNDTATNDTASDNNAKTETSQNTSYDVQDAQEIQGQIDQMLSELKDTLPETILKDLKENLTPEAVAEFSKQVTPEMLENFDKELQKLPTDEAASPMPQQK